MLLNFDTSSVVAEFSHLAVCGWTVASPSLSARDGFRAGPVAGATCMKPCCQS